MKKLSVFIALFFYTATAVFAQGLLTKVPADASMVIKYAGENFKTLVPTKKLDTYGFIRKEFFSMLNVDTLTSIENMGINFEQDSYQYITTVDSSLSFVTLMNVKSPVQFLQFIKASYGTKNKVEQRNGFQILSISDNTYIGWNDTKAVIVNASYPNRISYYNKDKNDEAIEAVKGAAEAAVMTPDTAAAVAAPVEDDVKFTPPKIVKDGYKAPKRSSTTKTKNKSGIKTPAKKGAVAKKKKTYVPKIYEESGAMVVEEAPYSVYNDSIEDRKRELWDQQQDIIVRKRQQNAAEIIMNNLYNLTVNSIENKTNYTKVIEPNAHISVWLNTDNLLGQYQNYFSRNIYSYLKFANASVVKDTAGDFKTGTNMYFEKDKMRVETKSFAENVETNNLGKAIMNSKQNSSLVNYVNPGNLGYFSMSINAEAMMNYYYTTLKKYVNNTPYMNEYSDMVNVYIDFMQILIDEKGIADMLPGNYMFVTHGMKSKMVDYIDYEYDNDYNKKEIKKKKKELVPDFTFAMETRREDFMTKLARLPLKYAKKEKFNYKENNGYFEFQLDSTKYPIASIYYVIKDGKVVMTTNKDVVNNTLSNTSFNIDAENKNTILNNNYAIKIDTKKIFGILEEQASTKINKKLCAYMKNNMGDITTVSSFKDGMQRATTTVAINTENENSLAFMFNALEFLNNSYQEDRIERSNKND
jgi:Domain of unknown function (DUF4836)